MNLNKHRDVLTKPLMLLPIIKAGLFLPIRLEGTLLFYPIVLDLSLGGT